MELFFHETSKSFVLKISICIKGSESLLQCMLANSFHIILMWGNYNLTRKIRKKRLMLSVYINRVR